MRGYSHLSDDERELLLSADKHGGEFDKVDLLLRAASRVPARHWEAPNKIAGPAGDLASLEF